MPTRAQVCAWIAGFGLVVPSLAVAQDRTEREVVDLIVRDGPQAQAIRAETDVTRREQHARLAYPNPASCTAGRVRDSPSSCRSSSRCRYSARATRCREPESPRRRRQRPSGTRGCGCCGRTPSAAVARLVAEQARLEAAKAHVARSRTADRDTAHARARRRRVALRSAACRTGTARRAPARARPRRSSSPRRERRSSAMLPARHHRRRGSPARSDPSTRPSAPLETLMTRATSTRAELRALQQLGRARRAGIGRGAPGTAARARHVFGGLKRADTESGRETRRRLRRQRVGAAVRYGRP